MLDLSKGLKDNCIFYLIKLEDYIKKYTRRWKFFEKNK